MLNLILSSIYFILPAYFANMSPILFKWIPFGGSPINEKAFGSHKTWRGFYVGYIGALLILLLQFYLQKNGLTQPVEYPNVKAATLLDYQSINLFLYAFLFGVGAITGDLIKSFFKRRIKIAPGQPWFPFDQLDFVIFTFLFLWPFFLPPWQVILTIFIITPLLHFLTNVLGYFFKVKKVWW